MGYWLLQDNVGEWAVDWDVVYRIIRGWHTAARRLSNYTVETTDVWTLGPTLRHYSFDWDTIRKRSIASADEDFARLAARATVNMRGVQEELQWMVSETRKLTREFADMMRAMQVENLQNAEAVRERAEWWTEFARGLRDASAEFVLIGATVLSGGAAAAAIGGGAAMKGVFKYQDTDSMAGAIMTTTGTIMFAAVKIGGGEAMKEAGARGVMIVMQSAWETGAALAEGKPVGDAVASGAGKLIGGVVGDRLSNGVFKTPAAQKLLSRAGAYVTVAARKVDLPGVDTLYRLTNTAASERLRGKEAVSLVGSIIKKRVEVVAKADGKLAVKDLYRGGNDILNNGWTNARSIDAFLNFGEGGSAVVEQPVEPRREETVLSSATLQDDLLLSLAIVNMKTGIVWRNDPNSSHP
jgi:hypothetical protein